MVEVKVSSFLLLRNESCFISIGSKEQQSAAKPAVPAPSNNMQPVMLNDMPPVMTAPLPPAVLLELPRRAPTNRRINVSLDTVLHYSAFPLPDPSPRYNVSSDSYSELSYSSRSHTHFPVSRHWSPSPPHRHRPRSPPHRHRSRSPPHCHRSRSPSPHHRSRSPPPRPVRVWECDPLAPVPRPQPTSQSDVRTNLPVTTNAKQPSPRKSTSKTNYCHTPSNATAIKEDNCTAKHHQVRRFYELLLHHASCNMCNLGSRR